MPGLQEDEPKTSVEKLYAEIKTKYGKPWPETLFLEGLNAALAQGFIARISGKGPLTSLKEDLLAPLSSRRKRRPHLRPRLRIVG